MFLMEVVYYFFSECKFITVEGREVNTFYISDLLCYYWYVA